MNVTVMLPNLSSLYDAFDNTTSGNFMRDRSDDKQIVYPHIVEHIFIYTVAFLIFVLNIPVFFVVPKVNSLQKSTGRAMLALACTDMGLGVAIVVFRTYQTIVGDFRLSESSIICLLDGFQSPYFCSVSIILMTYINLDKFLLLQFPFKYKKVMNSHVINGTIISIWVIIFIFYSPMLIGWGNIKPKFYPSMYFCTLDFTRNWIHTILFYVLFLVFPTSAIATSFFGIYRIARTQRRKIKESQSNNVHLPKRESRIVFTLLCMTITYYILWTPYFMFHNIWELVTGEISHPIVAFLSVWMGACASFVNPLVYIPTMRSYRIRLFNLLHISHLLPEDDKRRSSMYHTTMTMTTRRHLSIVQPNNGVNIHCSTPSPQIKLKHYIKRCATPSPQIKDNHKMQCITPIPKLKLKYEKHSTATNSQNNLTPETYKVDLKTMDNQSYDT